MKTLKKLKTICIACSLFIVFSAKAQVPAFDSDKPAASFNSTYVQTFNTPWDNTTFYGQWNSKEANIFAAPDIASGYLQFVWIQKRVLVSKAQYVSPYILQTDIDYANGSNRGGIIIRVNPATDPDELQQPASGDPGFNREGIAFYPSEDGSKMIIQFTGALNGDATPVTRIEVPKPDGVASLKIKGTLRIEDFGTTVYIYYNGLAFIRINLSDKAGNIYTSGTVFNSDMQITGTFSAREVEAIGKVAIAQRDATLRLFGVAMQFNNLKNQTISFDPIGKKQSTDTPFLLTGTATSGLPVEFRIVSGPASIDGNLVTLNGVPGMVVFAAIQPGDSEYFPAEEVKQTVFLESPTASPETVQLKAYGDSWVATDALGRILPGYDECGDYRKDKYVGMFYWLWHANGRLKSPIKTYQQLMLENPESPAFEFTDSYWGEPEDGFYHPSDPWSTRRNLQMLANAGVDFVFFDFTNGDQGDKSLESFMTVAMDMYNKGIPVPKISFFMNENYNLAMPSVMNKIYSHPEYDPLLFKWHGKPLLMADTVKCATQWADINDKGIKDHFTWRKTWAFDANQWNFLDTYPQDYASFEGKPEQMPVSKALGAPTFTGGQGASMHNKKNPPYDIYWESEQSGFGFAFEEQWSRAHQIDPSIVCVTGWNELIAGAWISDAKNPVPFMLKNWDDPSWRCANQASCPNKDANGKHLPHGWYVVDEFNREFNRDIGPMKDGITDNYYYQLVSHIRRYKGMSAPEPISASKTVVIDGNFDEWIDVTPVFKDAQGDVSIRNFKNVNNSAILTNTTARNDISESRATFDANNIYFYVKTVQILTPSTGPNWMLLFMDVDRNKGTGWEGYDYVVNLGVKSSTETTLKQWDGKNWSNEVTVPYKLTGKEMELSVPRTAVLMDKSNPEFYFHWSDNAQQLDSINCFFTNGESAPDRRFNYNFSTSKIQPVPQTSFKDLAIPGTIEMEDFDNGGAGTAYADATFGNSGGAYRPDQSVDIEEKTGGGYNLGWVNNNEWLEYTANVNSIGKFTASINYAANGAGKEAILYVDDNDKSGIISFPSTGNLDTWSDKTIELQLTAGKHILKFFVKNAANDFKLDRIVFIEKEVVYPGKGTGLDKSLWKGSAPGTWFKDSICSQVAPVIDETWADVSPGCGIAKDFWNARWQGLIEPLFSELYTFYLTVNDMGRVWINNQMVIDGWVSTSSGKTLTGTMALTAGQKVPIKVDFAEKTADAKVKLEWSSASNPMELVPQSQLYPQTLINGISDDGVVRFKVFPNPATDRITIQTGRYFVESIHIIDLAGRTVYTGNESFSGTKSFNLALEKGIYLVKLKGSKPFGTQKLIIE